jgi:hypothetical protein
MAGGVGARTISSLALTDIGGSPSEELFASGRIRPFTHRSQLCPAIAYLVQRPGHRDCG